MKNNHRQSGFSLIELLLVVTIIGIIAAISFPYLKKAKYAAENAAMFATMRTLASTQVGFYSRNQRYATLPEISAAQPGAFGTLVGTTIRRGNFTIDMGNVQPGDASLKTDFTATATKSNDSTDLPYIISINSSARIVQITP